MINKPEKKNKKQSLEVVGKRIGQFFRHLPHTFLVTYNTWVEVGLIVIGGAVAAVILIAFIFQQPFGQESNTEYVSSVSLSTDKIDEVSAWVEAREDARESRDGIVSYSLFN